MGRNTKTIIGKRYKLKMKVLFVCTTYFHTLNAMLRTIKENINADMMLIHADTAAVEGFERLQHRIKESQIFQRVILEKNVPEPNGIFEKIFWRYGIFKRKVKSFLQVDLEDYDEIYVYYDSEWFPRYLKDQRMYYNIAEDGMNFSKKERHDSEESIWSMRKWRFCHLRRILRIGQVKSYKYYTESKYVKTIEVNDKEGIVFEDKKKIVEKPQKLLMENISGTLKSRIVDIYMDSQEFLHSNNIAIVLTEPLFVDHDVNSENEQLSIYKQLVEMFSEYQIIMKPHPRDTLDYNAIENVIIISRDFPCELLSWIDQGRIQKYITIGSTAIEGLPKEKVAFYPNIDAFYNAYSKWKLKRGQENISREH